MTAVPLTSRSLPDKLRYLAGQLSEFDDPVTVAVSLALQATADEQETAISPEATVALNLPGPVFEHLKNIVTWAALRDIERNENKNRAIYDAMLPYLAGGARP
jgi:hypothetical protein